MKASDDKYEEEDDSSNKTMDAFPASHKVIVSYFSCPKISVTFRPPQKLI